MADLYADFFAGVSATATSLDLRLLMWGEKEGLQLAQVLPCFTALTELDLRGNEFGEASARQLAAAVASHEALRMFDGMEVEMLRKQPLTASRLDMLDLVRLRSERVTQLDLTAMRVGDTGTLVISHLLPDMGALRDLRLGAMHFLNQPDPSNEIGDVGAAALARALKPSGLTALDLSANRIGPTGARELAALLGEMTSLVRLNLGGNEDLFGRRPRGRADIGVQGGSSGDDVARAFATALAANRARGGSLVSLVLGPNAGAPYRWAQDKRALRQAVRGRQFELVLFADCRETLEERDDSASCVLL